MDKSHPDIVKPDSGLLHFSPIFSKTNKQTNGAILACVAGGIVWVRN